MRYVRDAAIALHREASELSRLAREAGSFDGSHVQFVRTLLAYLTRADCGLSGEEFALLRQYNGDGFNYYEEVEYARDCVLDSPRFLRTVPSFVAAARRHDQQSSAGLVSEMIGCVERICQIVSQVDGVAQHNEMEHAAVLIATLRSAIDPQDDSPRAG